MNYAPCHFHNDAIRTLRHSILLKPIRDERLLLNTMVLHRLLDCLRNVLHAVPNQSYYMDGSFTPPNIDGNKNTAGS